MCACAHALACVFVHVCARVFTERTRGLLSEASKAPVGADSCGGYGGGRGSSRKGVEMDGGESARTRGNDGVAGTSRREGEDGREEEERDLELEREGI